MAMEAHCSFQVRGPHPSWTAGADAQPTSCEVLVQPTSVSCGKTCGSSSLSETSLSLAARPRSQAAPQRRGVGTHGRTMEALRHGRLAAVSRLLVAETAAAIPIPVDAVIGPSWSTAESPACR